MSQFSQLPTHTRAIAQWDRNCHVIRLRHYLSSHTTRDHLILVSNLLFYFAIVYYDCRKMMLYQKTLYKAKRLWVEVKRRCRAAAKYINLRGAKREDKGMVELSEFCYASRIGPPGPPEPTPFVPKPLEHDCGQTSHRARLADPKVLAARVSVVIVNILLIVGLRS
jgi:hypothetical protein